MLPDFFFFLFGIGFFGFCFVFDFADSFVV